MVIATLLGIGFTSGGLALSYAPDLPAGPTIILLAGAFYVVSAVLSGLLTRRRAQRLAQRPGPAAVPAARDTLGPAGSNA